MSDNIVENWLKSLDLAKYTQQFLDNGYDDLEICKQVGDPDLDAIGVETGDDRLRLLDAVKTLKEKGGTAVYLTLEDEEKKIPKYAPVRPTLDNLVTDVPPPSPSPAGGLDAEADSQLQRSSDLIVYPKLQLTLVIRDKLQDDRIDLASPPYTAQDRNGVAQKSLQCFQDRAYFKLFIALTMSGSKAWGVDELEEARVAGAAKVDPRLQSLPKIRGAYIFDS